MPVILFDGRKMYINGEHIHNIPGFTQDPKKPRIWHQNFEPCVYRKIIKCGTCLKSATRPTCTLKKIEKGLICIDCEQRDHPSMKQFQDDFMKALGEIPLED